MAWLTLGFHGRINKPIDVSSTDDSKQRWRETTLFGKYVELKEWSQNADLAGCVGGYDYLENRGYN
jgi:hypothetical protein